MPDQTESEKKFLAVNPDSIPSELKDHRQWVCWRLRCKQSSDGGRWEKVPINPNSGRQARTNKPWTWSSFDKAWEYYQRHQENGIMGIGFVFSKDDPYAGWRKRHRFRHPPSPTNRR
jgi:putative DNA primase/helicase